MEATIGKAASDGKAHDNRKSAAVEAELKQGKSHTNGGSEKESKVRGWLKLGGKTASGGVEKEEKARKRDKFRSLLGFSHHGAEDDKDQEHSHERGKKQEEKEYDLEEELYPQPKDQLVRRFPKPVHLDTTADAAELQQALESHMETLENETLAVVEEAIGCLVCLSSSSILSIAPSLPLLWNLCSFTATNVAVDPQGLFG